MKAKELAELAVRARKLPGSVGECPRCVAVVVKFAASEITRERRRASAARRKQDEARARRLADADAKMIERAKGARDVDK